MMYFLTAISEEIKENTKLQAQGAPQFIQLGKTQRERTSIYSFIHSFILFNESYTAGVAKLELELKAVPDKQKYVFYEKKADKFLNSSSGFGTEDRQIFNRNPK